MINEPRVFTKRQMLFKEIFVGTLIYAVVLGLLDDHTSIVEAHSFSDIFLAAIILEVLTCAVLEAKRAIIAGLRHRESRAAKLLMAFGVWLVMFSSKFVFIWAIDAALGDHVNIDGFTGVFVIALVVTVAHRLADSVFLRLGPRR